MSLNYNNTNLLIMHFSLLKRSKSGGPLTRATPEETENLLKQKEIEVMIDKGRS